MFCAKEMGIISFYLAKATKLFVNFNLSSHMLQICQSKICVIGIRNKVIFCQLFMKFFNTFIDTVSEEIQEETLS
jgi:hypothetical protein